MGALSGRRILLVEDEALIALDLQRMLERRGATVSVPEALEAINTNQIDCALLDVKLGDETTDPVAVALEQRAIPMVFVTAYSEARLPLGFEIRPLIQKPYSEDELLGLIDSFFDRLDTVPSSQYPPPTGASFRSKFAPPPGGASFLSRELWLAGGVKNMRRVVDPPRASFEGSSHGRFPVVGRDWLFGCHRSGGRSGSISSLTAIRVLARMA